MTPVKELRSYLAHHAAVCRSKRWLGSLFHVGVTELIAEDVAKNEERQAARAHRAELADIEAKRAIEAGDLKRAMADLNRAEQLTHDITESLA